MKPEQDIEGALASTYGQVVWRHAILLAALVALATACGSTTASKSLYTPDDVKRTFATNGVQLTSITTLVRAAVGDRFGVRAAFAGPGGDTGLRIVVYDRVYRQPPERDANLCAPVRTCQRLALVRNVEIFWSAGTGYAPTVRKVISELQSS